MAACDIVGHRRTDKTESQHAQCGPAMFHLSHLRRPIEPSNEGGQRVQQFVIQPPPQPIDHPAQLGVQPALSLVDFSLPPCCCLPAPAARKSNG